MIIEPSSYITEHIRNMRILRDGGKVFKKSKIKKRRLNKQTKREKRIENVVDLIYYNSMTSYEIAEAMELNDRTIRYYLEELKEEIPKRPELKLKIRREIGDSYRKVYYKIEERRRR